MNPALRIAFTLFLVLHGIAHGVGFAAAWRLGESGHAPLNTTLLSGRVDVGAAGVRAMGILWLLTGIAFGIAALGVARKAEWWPTLTVGVAVVSLGLSILEWPDARIGVAVNLLILTGLALAGRIPLE